MDNFIRKKIGSGPKNIKEMFFFWCFHILLHENTQQIFCAAPILLKITR